MRYSLWIGVLTVLLFPAALFGITIQLDYTFDTDRIVTGYQVFFDFIADDIEARIHDRLLAVDIAPTTIIHPSTGEYVSLGQMVHVPADTIIVYVGAYDLPDGRIAQAHFDYNSTPNNRGQSATDVGIWTGSISFDSRTNWQEYDISSVLRHELLHVLGFGLAPSFVNKVDGGHFFGPVATSEFGAPVPLSNDLLHLGVESSISLLDGWPRAPVMSASLPPSAHRYLTRLDLAILADLGWEIELPPLLAGDYNENKVVDAADYVLWRRQMGTPTGLRNDTSGASFIGTAQYNLWKGNFGRLMVSSPSAAQAPEPSSSTLALILISIGMSHFPRFRRP